MGSIPQTSSAKASTDKPNEMPIASTPTFPLASPSHLPASVIMMLATSGNSGIRM